MAEIIIIAAIANNNVIGNKGSIPWRIKEDFMHFKNLTLGHPCIMGRYTFESLPVKPLAGRENIVISSNKNYFFNGVKIVNSFKEAIKYIEKYDKAFICGGEKVYEEGLKIADTLELTKINLNPEGDAFFPKIKYDDWILINEEKHDKYSFLTYKRKKIIENK